MHHQIFLYPNHSLEEGWALLESAQIEILYGSEENGEVSFFIQTAINSQLPAFPWIKSIVPSQFDSIDWQEQWQLHGHNFHEGCVQIDISKTCHQPINLKLLPGAGFGDLSHPTTKLMLDLLIKNVNHQTVIDIGCGSGILTVAAVLLGAAFSYGLDIDPVAVEHSRTNSTLNSCQDQCEFLLPESFTWQQISSPVIILINMIESEQKIAWNSLACLHGQNALILASGIKKEDQARYLALTNEWGWTLKHSLENDGWMAYVYSV